MRTGRPKKDAIKISLRMEREIAEMLEKFCSDTARTKTRVMELAVKEYIEKHN